MKLYSAGTSPFVRKVMICAHEKGIAERLETVPTRVGGSRLNSALMAFNPTGKVPTLVTDAGEAIFDSLVIIDYFDQIVADPLMLPTNGRHRTMALRINTVADGLLVAGSLARSEASRPPERRWIEYSETQWEKVRACTAALDEILDVDAPPNIGHVAAAAALGWLDFRVPTDAWRSRHLRLARWFDSFSMRRSMVQTTPEA